MLDLLQSIILIDFLGNKINLFNLDKEKFNRKIYNKVSKKNNIFVPFIIYNKMKI